MNAPHLDICKYLTTEGVAELGDDLAGAEWMIDIDAQTLVMDSGGATSDLKDLYEEITIQILQRGEKNEAANLVYAKIKTIIDFLLSLPDSVFMNGCEYKGFEPVSNLAPLGRDDNERFIYSMNLTTFRKGV